MKRFNSENLMLIIVFFGGCIFSFVCINFSNIHFESKVILSDILSLLTTAFVGVYLGITIQKQHSSSRFEREYLISEIKTLIESIASYSVFKNFNSIDFNQVKIAFKGLNIHLTNFENTLEESSFCNRSTISHIRSLFSDFRKSILNLSPNPNTGLINPSLAERVIINKAYKTLRKELFKEIVEINNR